MSSWKFFIIFYFANIFFLFKVRIWDVKPFASANRCIKTFEGRYSRLCICARFTHSRFPPFSQFDWHNLFSRTLYMSTGAPHGFEKNLIRPAWSPDGTQIASGAGDRTVVVWDVPSRRILYKLPGHKGCVNDVDFHPREPILVSGSTDHMLFLGEINPSK